MAGPWDAYAQGGPWAKYGGQAAPATPANPWIDSLKGAAAGAYGSAAQMVDAINPFGGITKAIEGGAAALGHPIPTQVQALLPGGMETVASATGAGYQPKTTPGRYAKSVGAMVPNLVAGPEGAAAKVASVVLPGVLSQGAADATQAMGGGQTAQDVARFAGGVAGGLGAGAVSGMGATEGALNGVDQQAAKAISAANTAASADPATISAAADAGKLPLAANPGMGQLGEAVATLPGAGGINIRNAVQNRMADATDRALGAVQTHLGVDPEGARGNIDAVVKQGQAKAAPLYDQLRSNPAPVWNSQLQELAQRPAIKKAMNLVANDMLNAGQNPKTAGFALDPDTGWTIPASEPGALNNVEQQPTASTWINVHQALGRTIDRNPITGKPLPNSLSEGNFGVTQATNDLRDALAGSGGAPGAIPGYKDALNTAGDYLSTQNAFQRAKGKLFSGSTYDFNNMWNSLGSDAEKTAARSALANDVLESADRGNILSGRFKSPGVQEKLSIAFGKNADPFISQMESDAAERAIYNKIVGGSPTAGRQALLNAMKAQNKPAGVVGAAQKVMSSAHTIASMLHPATAVTKLGEMGLGAMGHSAETAMPWENPEVADRLGQLLSDPISMSEFLKQSANASQSALAARAAARQALLRGAATGGAFSGLAIPSAAQVGQ